MIKSVSSNLRSLSQNASLVQIGTWRGRNPFSGRKDAGQPSCRLDHLPLGMNKKMQRIKLTRFPI
jgi:hypothetical protein